MESGPRKHRITVDEYHRMAEIGLLAADARVELIEGEIIDMPPIGSDHGSVVDQLTQLIVQAVTGRAIVRVQGAVRLSSSSEPQPDVALLRLRPDFYRHEHPTGPNTLLVIEVSDTSLRYDRDVKVPLYARHEVPEVWLVDLNGERVLFYRKLVDGAYQDQFSESRPAEASPLALPEAVLDLRAIFAA